MYDAVIQAYISVFDIHPTIWRRVELPINSTLRSLHNAIQRALGWQDYHLHHFVVEGINYGQPMNLGMDDFLDIQDEKKIKLTRLMDSGARVFTYEYDYGDDWSCAVVLEGLVPGYEEQNYPRLVDGARRGPLEDSGGPWGYERMLEILDDPDHEDHEEIAEWIGDDFDPEAFDTVAINAELAKLNKSRRKPAQKKRKS